MLSGSYGFREIGEIKSPLFDKSGVCSLKVEIGLMTGPFTCPAPLKGTIGSGELLMSGDVMEPPRRRMTGDASDASE